MADDRPWPTEPRPFASSAGSRSRASSAAGKSVIFAATSRIGVELDESRVPVADAVRGACELLGLDPLHVANEGVCVAFVPAGQADAALDAMRAGPEGRYAVAAGSVVAEHPGRVAVRTLIGAYRILDMLVGEQLPRIC